MKEIMVSISCITFNHEQYISDAIESFLMQQTNFNYEILIHDDASTDRTVEIIKEYQKKYPNLIKPIYQTENQYSKGADVSFINEKRAVGKYLSICEGDDYWTDPHKLQKQFDFMEEHPECSLCVHGGKVVSTEKQLKYFSRPNKGNKTFIVEEVIKGGGGLFLTNSMFFPTVFIHERPDFLLNAPVGDYPSTINLALLGEVYYMDELMSAYRIGDSSSWTARNLSTLEKENNHFNKIAKMLDELNQYTKYQFDKTINSTRNYNQFFLLVKQRKFKQAKTEKFKEIYSSLGFRQKLKIFLDQYIPIVTKILRLLKRKLIT